MKLQPIKAPTADHALLSPSAAKKWVGCAASLACEVGIPNESGAAAVNGTAMHTMAEKALKTLISGGYGGDFDWTSWFNPTPDGKNIYITDYGKGDIAMGDNDQPGNVPVTDDFVSQVSKYVNYCAPIMAAAEVVEIESRVSLTRILHPSFELNGIKLETFGTADFVALLKQPAPQDGTYTLIVGDLKTGRHKVTAAENKQMMLYALGLLRKYRLSYDISAVKLFIFQPYAGGADEWDTTPTALEHFAKFASKQALKALDAYQRGKKGLTPADFRPSNDACQWCRFSEKCNAKVKAASHTMDEMADIGGLELTPDVLKAEWDKLPLMRQHIADIEKAMYTHLMAGRPMDGLKLVEGRPGNRAWADADKVELETLDYSDVMHKSVLLSPTEAEKVLAKESPMLWKRLEKLITRKPGQPSIAAADDKRPAWTPVSDEDLA